jgi:hypothetical protein
MKDNYKLESILESMLNVVTNDKKISVEKHMDGEDI